MSQETNSCSLCGGPLRHEHITYTQTIGDALYVVTEVPAEVCPRDAEHYLSPAIVDALQEMIERGAAPERTMQVPVYRFPRTAAASQR